MNVQCVAMLPTVDDAIVQVLAQLTLGNSAMMQRVAQLRLDPFEILQAPLAKLNRGRDRPVLQRLLLHFAMIHDLGTSRNGHKVARDRASKRWRPKRICAAAGCTNAIDSSANVADTVCNISFKPFTPAYEGIPAVMATIAGRPGV